MILGVSPKGIHMGSFDNHFGVNAYTTLYPYSAIVAWGTAPGVFSFYLATRPNQTKYSFSLQHADDVMDLIKHYTPMSCVCSLTLSNLAIGWMGMGDPTDSMSRFPQSVPFWCGRFVGLFL